MSFIFVELTLFQEYKMKKYAILLLLVVSSSLIGSRRSDMVKLRDSLKNAWSKLKREDVKWDSVHPSPPDPIQLRRKELAEKFLSAKLARQEKLMREHSKALREFESQIPEMMKKFTPEQKAYRDEKLKRYDRLKRAQKAFWDALHTIGQFKDLSYEQKIETLKRLIREKKAYLAARLEIHVAYMKRHGSKQ